MSSQRLSGIPRPEYPPEILADRMQANASRLTVYKPALPTTIPDLSAKSIDQKIDILIALAQGQNRSIINLGQDMGKVVEEIDTIKQGKTENETIKFE